MATKQPNLYELSGNGIHVTYSTTSITGKPLFNYHDSFQTRNFSGDEIQTVDTILGQLVSVFLVRTIDSGSTSFTGADPGDSPAADQCRQRHDGRRHHAAQVLDRQSAARADRTLHVPPAPRHGAIRSSSSPHYRSVMPGLAAPKAAERAAGRLGGSGRPPAARFCRGFGCRSRFPRPRGAGNGPSWIDIRPPHGLETARPGRQGRLSG